MQHEIARPAGAPAAMASPVPSWPRSRPDSCHTDGRDLLGRAELERPPRRRSPSAPLPGWRRSAAAASPTLCSSPENSRTAIARDAGRSALRDPARSGVVSRPDRRPLDDRRRAAAKPLRFRRAPARAAGSNGDSTAPAGSSSGARTPGSSRQVEEQRKRPPGDRGRRRRHRAARPARHLRRRRRAPICRADDAAHQAVLDLGHHDSRGRRAAPAGRRARPARRCASGAGSAKRHRLRATARRSQPVLQQRRRLLASSTPGKPIVCWAWPPPRRCAAGRTEAA